MPDTLNKQTLINLLIDSPLREPIKINLIDIVNNTNEPDLPKVYSTIIKELEIFQKATERRMKLAEETIAKLGGSATSTEPEFATELPEADAVSPEPTATTSAPSPSLHIEAPEATREMTLGAQQPRSQLDLSPLPTAPIAANGSQLPTSSEPPVTPAPAQPSVPPLPPLPPIPPIPTPPVVPTPQPVAPTPVSPAPVAPSVPPLSVPPLDLPPLPTAPLAPNGSEPTIPPAPAVAPTVPSSDEDALAEIQKELDSLKSAASADAATPAVTTPIPQM